MILILKKLLFLLPEVGEARVVWYGWEPSLGLWLWSVKRLYGKKLGDEPLVLLDIANLEGIWNGEPSDGSNRSQQQRNRRLAQGG